MQNALHLSIIFAACLLSFQSHAQIIEEGFENVPNLTPASNLPSGVWTTWSNSPSEEALVSNAQAANGTQSLVVTESADALVLLGNKTSGIYTVQWNMYVTNSIENEVAYYDFQKSETPGIEWGAEVFFFNNGIGQVNATTTDILFNFEFNTWFKVTHIIDLDADIVTMLIDDIEIGNWPASTIPGGTGQTGLKQLGAINFFSIHVNSAYFIDDMVFVDGVINHALVTGIIRHDENYDCLINGTENTLPNFGIEFQGQNGTSTSTTKSNGVYKWFAPLGNYSISVNPPNSYWDICPFNDQLQILNTNDTIQLDFSAKAAINCPAMTVDITALWLRRCFTNQLYVHYCNEGTIPGNAATIDVQLDSFFIYQSSTIPLSSQNGNVLSFELGNVGIGECGDFIINVLIDCQATLGQEHCYSAKVYPDTICNSTRADQSFTEECQLNIGSFDPNDKRAFPEGEGPNFTILPNQEIKYQIRFQNTGTDTAFNVMVVDTISPLLNLTTLRTGAASHPFTLSKENRAVKFHFGNILLPDSTTNEPGSHGFINFYISQVDDLPNGSKIENQASIYFDFNDPIWTNIALNTVDMPLNNTEQHQPLDMELSPNPISGKQGVRITSHLPVENGEVTIYQANGLAVIKQPFNGSHTIAPLNNLPAGLYWVRLADRYGHFNTKKLVVIE
ncbi:MAG: T9SS type A sorting domain-containing protein [Saprospiraceae bacterium]|nr:T9SS type A sorting domain-containing protein [Saprospiraceae bacterium]MCF8249793.1 T9SS type A sorting domain-containing protein [Saprospiraceae bacterium]MCF8279278.1 T9SS type A sorting domain-containing protein [Bacteroidales bacterium]MCF8313456.1 T9SS type A sorting domain-containing protein [Saprospiraceae bacterium]MCF8442169.1 T9SS type A sorting domain-containing protein [Saprospiraceae bacterium]